MIFIARLVRKIYVKSGTFEVPKGVSGVRVVVIGGGAGGGSGSKGGGGSGYVEYKFIDVKYKEAYEIIVGKGGESDENGGNSSFGTLLYAEGGKTAIDENGGDGGSGGGAGVRNGSAYAGSGAWNGTDGVSSEDSYHGGKGQNNWYLKLLNFELKRITVGPGGYAGFPGDNCDAAGGGGGGGVTVDHTILTAGSGAIDTDCKGRGGWCFGAGGGAGGTGLNGSHNKGGSGADGLVYIEYSHAVNTVEN